MEELYCVEKGGGNMSDLQSAMLKAGLQENQDDFFDDDIDTIDEEMEPLPFETDAHGNYVRLLEHLDTVIPPGEPKPNIYQRAELFHESVIETIMDTWVQSSQLCTKLLVGFPFVGLYLDTTVKEIGGFSQKSKRDEQKGTIIECINSGRIATLVTPNLLQKGCFVFLPNAATLGAMQEFPLLTDYVYKICFVSKRGDVRVSDIDISYRGIANMIVQNFYIQDMLVSALEGYVPGGVDVDAPGERDTDEYEENGHNVFSEMEDDYDGYEDEDEEEYEDDDMPPDDDFREVSLDDIPDDFPDDFPD